jgi:hypothetical protein
MAGSATTNRPFYFFNNIPMANLERISPDWSVFILVLPLYPETYCP